MISRFPQYFLPVPWRNHYCHAFSGAQIFLQQKCVNDGAYHTIGKKLLSTKYFQCSSKEIFFKGIFKQIKRASNKDIQVFSYSTDVDHDALVKGLETVKSLIEKFMTAKNISNRDKKLQLIDECVKKILLPGELTDFEKIAQEVPPQELCSLGTIIISLQRFAGEHAITMSVPFFRSAALNGDAHGKYSYAQLLLRGSGGLTVDPYEAARLLKEIASNELPQAQFTLAGMYSTGKGIELDFDKAIELYESAASNGIPQGYHAIGQMYLSGNGVDEDEKKAVEFFEKGAAANDPNALLSLGNCYSNGKGIEEDWVKMFDCHKKAADMGFDKALHTVGTHYFNGKGTEQNFSKAKEYFERASNLGFSLSQVNLGNMYAQGLSVEKDYQRAKEYYTMAAPNLVEAQLRLEDLEKRIEEEKER